MNNVKAMLWRGYVSAAPPSFRRAVDIRRRKPFWDRDKLLFIHVPKAAGTSVSRAVYGRSLGHFYARDIRDVFPAAFEDWFKFTLVRNPWSRVLSAYVFARTGRTDVAGVHEYERYLQDPRFCTFERFVLEWLPQANLSEEDNIFREQWRYLCDDDMSLLVDHVGRVENTDETADVLSSYLGRPVEIGRLNSLGGEQDYRRRYNREMVRRVGEVYRDDINLFGYDF